jgi:hypothetical protein
MGKEYNQKGKNVFKVIIIVRLRVHQLMEADMMVGAHHKYNIGPAST